MFYWIHYTQCCPLDGSRLIRTNKIFIPNFDKSIPFPIFECSYCRRKFLKFYNEKFASKLNVSYAYLNYDERNRIRNEISLNKCLAENNERTFLEAERRQRLLADYAFDEISVSDYALFEDASKILKEIYGNHAKFRIGQYEAIERTIKEKRLLVVQKTGWGKSIVYFICTKLLRKKGEGVTLVISPLLSLMENQLDAAKRARLECNALNSSTRAIRNKILHEMELNKYDLVFATPEALTTNDFKSSLPNIKIGLLVIDEAHCISDWGHDFRLEYNKIYKLIENLPKSVAVLATTATATEEVINDLKTQIGNMNCSRGHLMRENLSIQVLNIPDKLHRYAWILDNITRLEGTGIIYCLSKRGCKSLAQFLRENGVSAETYFSGNSKIETISSDNLNKFLNDEIKVIVSTIKLGMGFDKGNVAFIIHFQCPKNVMAYYQQIGRAGRSIPFAKTFLMMGEEDFRINKSFIKNAFPSESDMKEVRQYILEHKDGCSSAMIRADMDISVTRLLKVLDFLEQDDFIESKWKVSTAGRPYKIFYSTAKPFKYRREHYEKIRDRRYKELEQMQELANNKECLNRAVASYLDDIVDHDCHVCCNCNPNNRLPIRASQRSEQKAKDFFWNNTIPIEPWMFWPRNNKIGHENKYPNLPGVALTKYNNGEIGELVRIGKYGIKGLMTSL